MVDTLDILLDNNGQPDESYFHDEIHPTDQGFEKVAKRIMQVAQDAAAWP